MNHFNDSLQHYVFVDTAKRSARYSDGGYLEHKAVRRDENKVRTASSSGGKNKTQTIGTFYQPKTKSFANAKTNDRSKTMTVNRKYSYPGLPYDEIARRLLSDAQRDFAQNKEVLQINYINVDIAKGRTATIRFVWDKNSNKPVYKGASNNR